MLIVLEGVDKTGKTTLAEAIAARRPSAVIRHHSRPEVDPLVEYEGWFADFHPRSGAVLIEDRLHWGEMVWPHVYERPTTYDEAKFLHTELYLQSRGAVVVHCTADAAYVIDALCGSPYPPADRVGEALARFDAIAARTRLPSIDYDFRRGSDLDFTAETVIAAAERARDRALPAWRVTPYWIGSAAAEVLLVGPATWRDQVPFYPTGACGWHLMDLMLDDPLTWRRVALTNVADAGGSRIDLLRLWDALGFPRVVALGQAASDSLDRWGVPHGTMASLAGVAHFGEPRSRYRRALAEAIRGLDCGEKK